MPGVASKMHTTRRCAREPRIQACFLGMVASAIVDSDIFVGLSAVAYISVGSRRGCAVPAGL